MNQPDFEYLGPYHIQKLLGRGGMGSVYQGLHKQSGQPVAIKVIATGIANQPRFRRRFAAEIEALKRLKHPHIVSLVGYGEEHGLLFYSMEYVAGRSLHEVIRSQGRLGWQEVVQIGVETTSALKHAHNIGIIHRDLKPANLMLDQEGKIKLTDFGIAKLYGSSDETAAGSVIGTADYMPPEQAEGKTVTVRSDLYSLGCVLYALLAGKSPFGGKSVPEVLYAVRYTPVPPLQDLTSGVPGELIELIHQLLEKDPLKRPPTALVVSNRLKSVQQALKGHATSLGTDVNEKPGDSPGTRIPPSSNPTVVGAKLTSLDMDDEKPNAQGTARHVTQTPSTDTSFRTNPSTQEQQTLVASESMLLAARPDSSPQSREGHLSSEHFHQSSAASAVQGSRYSAVSGSGPTTNPSVLTSGGPSHYTPVSESDSRSFTIASEKDDPHSGSIWPQYLSIAGIVAALAASIGVVVYKLRPESADTLYTNIMQAVESGDDMRLLDASGAVEDFIHRFPDDERFTEIKALADEAELLRRVRIVQRKASRSGGLNELSAAEQGFLECMQTRNQDYQRGQEKLTAFIQLFSLERLSATDARLVELAQHAKQMAASIPIAKDPAAKGQLETLIQAAESSLSTEKLVAFYRNILLLYEDKPWAKDQVARIKQRLEPR